MRRAPNFLFFSPFRVKNLRLDPQKFYMHVWTRSSAPHRSPAWHLARRHRSWRRARKKPKNAFSLRAFLLSALIPNNRAAAVTNRRRLPRLRLAAARGRPRSARRRRPPARGRPELAPHRPRSRPPEPEVAPSSLPTARGRRRPSSLPTARARPVAPAPTADHFFLIS
jgi:hypothetical protein